MIQWNCRYVNKITENPRRFPPRVSYNTSKTISRVLYLTVIYLDDLLPDRSSHLPRTAGQAICPPTVLLRIEFTASVSLQPMGELLPRLSTLTSSTQAPYLSFHRKRQNSIISLRLLFLPKPLCWVSAGVLQRGGISLLHFS